MTWLLVPGRASGPLALGASAADARAALGEPRRSVDGDEPTDEWTDVHAHYDGAGRTAAVEVWPEVEPALDDLAVLAQPYLIVVRRLRRIDPHLVVDADGATSLTAGIGVAAPAGVHAPFEPASSAIVFVDGYYGDLFDRDPRPSTVAVRGLSFERLASMLEADGWSVHELTQLAPLVAGEPELVELRRGDERVRSSFQPVVGLRTLDLTTCGSEAAKSILARVPRWAAVDSAAALTRPADDEELLWGLVLAAALADPALLEHVERYLAHPRAVIADAAERAVARLTAT